MLTIVPLSWVIVGIDKMCVGWAERSQAPGEGPAGIVVPRYLPSRVTAPITNTPASSPFSLALSPPAPAHPGLPTRRHPPGRSSGPSPSTWSQWPSCRSCSW